VAHGSRRPWCWWCAPAWPRPRPRPMRRWPVPVPVLARAPCAELGRDRPPPRLTGAARLLQEVPRSVPEVPRSVPKLPHEIDRMQEHEMDEEVRGCVAHARACASSRCALCLTELCVCGVRRCACALSKLRRYSKRWVRRARLRPRSRSSARGRLATPAVRAPLRRWLPARRFRAPRLPVLAIASALLPVAARPRGTARALMHAQRDTPPQERCRCCHHSCVLVHHQCALLPGAAGFVRADRSKSTAECCVAAE